MLVEIGRFLGLTSLQGGSNFVAVRLANDLRDLPKTWKRVGNNF